VAVIEVPASSSVSSASVQEEAAEEEEASPAEFVVQFPRSMCSARR